MTGAESGAVRRSRRGIGCLLALFGFGLVVVLGLRAGSAALRDAPRSPGEMIDHAERRLVGHPRLQRWGVPMLEELRVALGEPSPAERALPFAVPPLAPNPMQAPAAAAADDARVIRVGPTRAIRTIAEAARRAVDGSVIEIDPGDYHRDVAVWDRARLTIRGRGDRVRLIADGASAEGKAIWVVRRGEVTIENIEFVGARVPDRNGAGIRLESGQLLVRQCRFYASESGIITAADVRSTLDVEDSEFGFLGQGDGYSHGIYVGAIASFRLVGSYLHDGNAGHLVKSRAWKNVLAYNRLIDGPAGRSSYEVEFPNGGEVEMVANVVEQGRRSRNSVIVSYAAEGYRYATNRLHLRANVIVNDGRWGGTFVHVAPGPAKVELVDNLWAGGGRLDVPPGAQESGNRSADWPYDIVVPPPMKVLP